MKRLWYLLWLLDRNGPNWDKSLISRYRYSFHEFCWWMKEGSDCIYEFKKWFNFALFGNLEVE